MKLFAIAVVAQRMRDAQLQYQAMVQEAATLEEALGRAVTRMYEQYPEYAILAPSYGEITKEQAQEFLGRLAEEEREKKPSAPCIECGRVVTEAADLYIDPVTHKKTCLCYECAKEL